LLTWLGPRLPRRLAYGIGFLLAGAPRYVVLAFATTVPPLAVVSFVAGFGAGSINPILGAVEYERVPRHLQARVLGVLGALAWAGIPFGGLLGGAGVEALGLTPTLLLAAAIYGLTTLAPFVLPAWRQMDRRPAEASGTVASRPGLEPVPEDPIGP
jgi:MFS family permease